MEASGGFFTKAVGGIVLCVGCGCAANAMNVPHIGLLAIELGLPKMWRISPQTHPLNRL